MKYTYRILSNDNLNPAGQEFINGVLSVLKESQSPWQDIFNTTETPEVCFTMDHLITQDFKKFQINWKMPDQNAEQISRRNQCVNQFGRVRQLHGESYYLDHVQKLETPESKHFFTSMHRNYTYNNSFEFGVAVARMLDEIMFTEECMEHKEEPV